MVNLHWLPDGGEGHPAITQQYVDFWTRVKQKTNCKTITEIGFNAGHTSALLLTLFKDINIQSFDICQYEVTKHNAGIIIERFPDRFKFNQADSLLLTPADVNSDIVFVDGCHQYQYVVNDINLFLNSQSQYIVLDDLQIKRHVKKAYDQIKDKLKVINKQTYTSSTNKTVEILCCQKTN